tara:strand:- start:130 stop:357 length:228 start_codon:yes stop_codon:yes gene_type:complete
MIQAYSGQFYVGIVILEIKIVKDVKFVKTIYQVLKIYHIIPDLIRGVSGDKWIKKQLENIFQTRLTQSVTNTFFC